MMLIPSFMKIGQLVSKIFICVEVSFRTFVSTVMSFWVPWRKQTIVW